MPPSVSNPGRRFEPESQETEMPPFDNSFFDELFDAGPYEGAEVIPNCGVNEATKDTIAEYLKSRVDFFEF